MPWWAWIVFGAFLLASELAFIDAQFYLVFFGVAALLVGALGLTGVVIPEWSQWVLFALLSIAALVLFRRQLYGLLAKNTAHLETGPSGEDVIVPIDLAPGNSCRVDFRGSTWTAQNKSDHVINAGSQARIVHVDGLTLQIRPSKH